MRLLLLDESLNFSKIKYYLDFITSVSVRNPSAHICALHVGNQFCIYTCFLEEPRDYSTLAKTITN